MRLHPLLLILALTLPIAAQGAADSVSTKTYNKLTDAQELMGENKVEEAIRTLTELLAEVKDDTIDQALTLQMLGYAEMGAERFDDAIVHLKQSLALNRLPESVKYNVGYMVAQLHAAQGEFDEALAFAAEWFETLEAPSASQMMFMANIYAQTKRYQEAIPYAERAIASTDEPRESWYQLLTAANFELKRFDAAATALQQMITLWPDQAGYWEQLASVYVLREEEDRALGVLRLAWLQGVLEKESSIKSMVQLAVTRGIPEHAARLIEQAFEAKVLPRDEYYVDLLANAWVSAREDTAAIETFTELARLKNAGEPLLRVANLHVERGRWAEAQGAIEEALSLDLEEPGKAWLLLGITLSEQQRFKEGFEALRKARTFDSTRSQATRWLSYAEDMRKQHEWQASFRG